MFRRPTIRYSKMPEAETPYQRAAQVWDDRIGSARVQARNWRLAFFGTLVMCGGLAGGLVWQSTNGSIVPWVVEVDKLGEARSVEPATADYRPTDPQVAFHLARFIEDVRSVAADRRIGVSPAIRRWRSLSQPLAAAPGTASVHRRSPMIRPPSRPWKRCRPIPPSRWRSSQSQNRCRCLGN